MIRVVNKHYHKPSTNDVYIGRGSPLGNVFTHLPLKNTTAVHKCKTRDEAIEKYKHFLIEKMKTKDKNICDELDRIYKLASKNDVNLVCYCYPKKCHGDVIKRILDIALAQNKI